MTTTTNLFKSNLATLTPGFINPDGNKIVVAQPSVYNVSNRLEQIFNSYTVSNVTLNSSACELDAATIEVDISLIRELITLFEQASYSCPDEINAMLGYLKDLMNQNNLTTGSVRITRRFYDLASKAIRGLLSYEKVSAIKGFLSIQLASAINSDVQSERREDALLNAIKLIESDTKNAYGVDDAFREANPLLEIQETDPLEAVLDTITELPIILGDNSGSESTSISNLDLSYNNDIIPQISGDDYYDYWADVVFNLKALFSSLMLATKLVEIPGLVSNKGTVLATEDGVEVKITGIDASAKGETAIATVADLLKVTKEYTVSGTVATEVDVKDYLHMTPLELDWVVSAATNDKVKGMRNIAHLHNGRHYIGVNHIEAYHKSLEGVGLKLSADEKIYVGARTRKMYSLNEVKLMANILSSIWSGMKSTFVKPGNWRKAGQILECGLAAGGQIFGKSSLTTASQVMNVFNQGFGALFPPKDIQADPDPTTLPLSPRAILEKTALSTIPLLIDTGVAELRLKNKNHTKQRSLLGDAERYISAQYAKINPAAEVGMMRFDLKTRLDNRRSKN